MRITFQEVSVKATRRWTEDGKKRQETRKFWQTINPFNKNVDGAMKNRDEIYTEICAQRDAWLRDQCAEVISAKGEK